MKLGGFRVVVLLALLLTFFGCSASEEVPRLEVLMEVDSSMLIEGRVVLNSTIHNRGLGTLVFLPWGSPFESSVTAPFLKVKVRKVNGLYDVPYEGMLVKRRAPQAEDFLELEAGSSYKRSLDITKSYTFCPGQTYILEYQGPLYSLDFTELLVSGEIVEFSTHEAFPPCGQTE